MGRPPSIHRTTVPERWSWPPGVRKEGRELVPAILWTLHLHGDIESEAGQATMILRRRMRQHGQDLAGNASVYLHALATGAYGPCIQYITGGKACYAIRLLLKESQLPPNPFQQADVQQADVQQADVPANGSSAGNKLIGVKDQHIGTTADPIDLLLTIQSLATQVILSIAQIAAPPQESERLSAALEETERLRKNLRDANETARAKSQEADAVRKALVRVQANLDAMISQSKTDDSGFRALHAIMTERPSERARSQAREGQR